jgi:hypothetical protein
MIQLKNIFLYVDFLEFYLVSKQLYDFFIGMSKVASKIIIFMLCVS